MEDPGKCSANHGGFGPIFERFVNSCWFFFKWGLALAAIAAAVGGVYLYRQVDETIRCHVHDQIAQHYTHLEVTVGSARLVEGEGIRVRDLAIIERGAQGPGAELINLDEMSLACSTDLQELMTGKPRVTQITIRRPTLRLTRRPDGTWSVEKLLPFPKLSERPPAMKIEQGTIEIFDPTQNPASTFTLRDVNLMLEAPDPHGPTPNLRKLKGTFGGDHLHLVRLEGWIDSQRHVCSLSGTVEGLEISPEFRQALPDPFAEKLEVIGGLRGQGSLQFKLAYDPAATTPLEYGVTGSLERGRITDDRLPHSLTDIAAKIRLDNRELVLSELTARSGQAALRMSARQIGWKAGSPVQLWAEVRQLELDRALLDVLPDTLRKQWYKYRPEGRINATVKLLYDGRTWQPTVEASCLDVSFTHEKFPYRVDDADGTVNLDEDGLHVNLTAYAAGQPVSIRAEVQAPLLNPDGAPPAGWFEASGDGIPLDKDLLAALRPKAREVVGSMHPRGTMNFHTRMWRDQPGGPLRKQLWVNLNRCSICYDKFPYPLSNITGRLTMQDDHWNFNGLQGTNDTGRVTCEGWMLPPAQGGELFLHYEGSNVPMEEELCEALKPNIQRVWNDLRPRGMIDLGANVRYLPSEQKLSVEVTAWPQSDTASIEPTCFPYRMDKLRGQLVYRDGRVTMSGFRAVHGAVEIAADGQCDFHGDGSWDFRLMDLKVDRLYADRELTQALPERLKKAITELKPTGPINLTGKVGFRANPKPGGPIQSYWDLNIGLNGGSLDCGVELKNVYGSMALAGSFDGQHVRSRGELAIDSLTWRDYQFTQVMGPLWIDDQRVLLGSWVERRNIGRGDPNAASDPNGPQPRKITAQLFGGTVFGDVWITLDGEPRYSLQASLAGADLQYCAREVMAGRQDLTGEIMASIDLSGSGRSRNNLRGRGSIRLRRADVYELPVMIAMLKILSIRPPDQTAFSKSDMDFRIEGEHIYFDRINFNGDAISLVGKGELDFQSNVALTFYTMVGRDEIQLPVIRELMGGASQQFLQIYVTGTLQDPVTRKEVLPGVGNVLEQLQGSPSRSAPSQPAPHVRNWMPRAEGRQR